MGRLLQPVSWRKEHGLSHWRVCFTSFLLCGQHRNVRNVWIILPPPHTTFTHVFYSDVIRVDQEMRLTFLNRTPPPAHFPPVPPKEQPQPPKKSQVWRSYVKVTRTTEICPYLQSGQRGTDTPERGRLPQTGTQTAFSSHTLGGGIKCWIFFPCSQHHYQNESWSCSVEASE